MNYIGDFAEDETVYLSFNTFTSDDPSASCTITNFVNTDIHIHRDSGVTQRNNAAGVVVSVDFDGITGNHIVAIDTSDNTVANFWITGHDYFVRAEGTTIDGATVNAFIAHFSIENRYTRGTDSAALATTALSNVTWTAAKAGHINADISSRSSHTAANVWAVGTRALTDKAGFSLSTAGIKAIWDQLTNVLTTAGSIGKLLVDNINATISSRSSHSAADVWTSATRALTDKSGFALSATGANLILKDSTFALAMADAIWDEILTGATHNIATSAGRRVREIGAFAISSGTAQAGNSHSITLAATADANDGVYNRNLIVLTDNTGVGQTRTIVDYDGTTKIVVVDRDWRVSPDATTAYQIVPDDTPLTVDHGIARGGTNRTITIRAYASSVDDAYLCNIVTIIAGKGRGQARLVGAYDGTTNVVTICGDDWVDIPDTTSVYVMMPYGVACAACIGDSALAQIKSEAADALSDVNLHTHDQNLKAILFSELV